MASTTRTNLKKIQVLLFVLHQSLDLCEHLLHQLARFGEPFGEQAVGVDLHQLTTFEEFPHPRVTSFIKTESCYST